MITIKIKNFQAITDALLEVSGFTTLVGRSNVGKSSIIRAIQSSITNKPPTGYVRRGTNSAFVSISDNNGFSFEWEKGKSISEYTINKTKYKKTGRDVPEEISNNGFKQLEVNGQNLDVQIGAQWSPLFILSKSGFLLADLVSSFTGLTVLIDAIRLANEDLSRINKGLNTLKSNFDNISNRILAFGDIDNFKSMITDVSGLVDAISARKLVLTQLIQFKNKVEAEACICVHNKTIRNINIPEVEVDVRHIDGLVSMNDEYTTCMKLATIDVPDLPHADIDRMVEEQGIRDYLLEKNKQLTRLTLFTQLNVPEVVSVPDEFSDLCNNLDKLRLLNNQVVILESSLDKMNNDLTLLDNQIHDTETEIDSLLESMSVCDVCGTVVHDHTSN